MSYTCMLLLDAGTADRLLFCYVSCIKACTFNQKYYRNCKSLEANVCVVLQNKVPAFKSHPPDVRKHVYLVQRLQQMQNAKTIIPTICDIISQLQSVQKKKSLFCVLHSAGLISLTSFWMLLIAPEKIIQMQPHQHPARLCLLNVQHFIRRRSNAPFCGALRQIDLQSAVAGRHCGRISGVVNQQNTPIIAHKVDVG